MQCYDTFLRRVQHWLCGRYRNTVWWMWCDTRWAAADVLSVAWCLYTWLYSTTPKLLFWYVNVLLHINACVLCMCQVPRLTSTLRLKREFTKNCWICERQNVCKWEEWLERKFCRLTAHSVMIRLHSRIDVTMHETCSWVSEKEKVLKNFCVGKPLKGGYLKDLDDAVEYSASFSLPRRRVWPTCNRKRYWSGFQGNSALFSVSGLLVVYMSSTRRCWIFECRHTAAYRDVTVVPLKL
jgi:hypothetical protein